MSQVNMQSQQEQLQDLFEQLKPNDTLVWTNVNGNDF
jgi:hypothetical protein